MILSLCHLAKNPLLLKKKYAGLFQLVVLILTFTTAH